MEALGRLPSIWHWVIWYSLQLRHLVNYQVITISPRPSQGKWCNPLLDLWATRPSPRTSYHWLIDLALDLSGNEEIKIKHLIILLIYESVLWMGMNESWGPWRTLETTCCGHKKHLKDHETLVLVHVTIKWRTNWHKTNTKKTFEPQNIKIKGQRLKTS